MRNTETVVVGTETVVVEEPPKEFICPITREIMRDPVVTSDGHTYERVAIAKWFNGRKTSPMTNLPLRSTALTPNRALQSSITEFLSKQSAVTAATQQSNINEHLLECPLVSEGQHVALLVSTTATHEPDATTLQESSRHKSFLGIKLTLAFYAAAISGTAYFTKWILNNAGPLMLTVGAMDNCYTADGNNPIGVDDSGATISCPQLAAMDPKTNWPGFGVYGCVDEDNYQRSVGSLLANYCTSSLMNKCVSLFANAFFDGSREIPYSRFGVYGKYVTAYGVFCEKDASVFLGIAFILAAAAASMMVAHGAVLSVRLWRQKSNEPASQVSDHLISADVTRYNAV